MSAKENRNIEDTFYKLAKEIKDKVLSNDSAMYSSSTLKNPKITNVSQ